MTTAELARLESLAVARGHLRDAHECAAAAVTLLRNAGAHPDYITAAVKVAQAAENAELDLQRALKETAA